MGVTLLILAFVFVFVSSFGLVIYVYVDVENRKGQQGLIFPVERACAIFHPIRNRMVTEVAFPLV